MPFFEYNKDYPFAAFITNLGKYNEGYLIGEWVKFPTTYEALQETFKRIGIGQRDEFGCSYEEWFITDYDCYVDGLYDKLGEYANLDELNYLASKLDEMSQDEYGQFEAAMSMGEYTGSIQNLINLCDNLDCYEIYPNINDDDDLGRFYLDECGTMEVPEYLQNYIDYEAYGRDVRFEEGGEYTDAGYIFSSGSSFHEYYDGDRESIPEEYRVMSAPDGDELTEENTFAIYQLRSVEETTKHRFSSLELLQKLGLFVEATNYDKVYEAPLEPGMELETIYTRFNIDRPADFTGHSLSVSDIVVLHQDGTDTAHYCDSVGFAEVPEFLHPELTPQVLSPDTLTTGERVSTPRGSFSVTAMTKEQMEAAGYGLHHTSEDGKYLIMGNGTSAFAVADERDNPLRTAEMTIEDDYDMIDGVINNGRSDEAAEKPSIRERLAEAKRECAERKPPEKKDPSRDTPGHDEP